MGWARHRYGAEFATWLADALRADRPRVPARRGRTASCCSTAAASTVRRGRCGCRSPTSTTTATSRVGARHRARCSSDYVDGVASRRLMSAGGTLGPTTVRAGSGRAERHRAPSTAPREDMTMSATPESLTPPPAAAASSTLTPPAPVAAVAPEQGRAAWCRSTPAALPGPRRQGRRVRRRRSSTSTCTRPRSPPRPATSRAMGDDDIRAAAETSNRLLAVAGAGDAAGAAERGRQGRGDAARSPPHDRGPRPEARPPASRSCSG